MANNVTRITKAGDRTVRCVKGEQPRVIEDMERVLIQSGEPVYQRGGQLVRPVHIPVGIKVQGVDIPPGTLVLEPVTAAWLGNTLTREARFVKPDSRTKDAWVRCDCPAIYPRTYVELVGEWRVPYLAGITECPLILPDGRILTEPGYDPESGLYFRYTGPSLDVPEEPTRADAMQALNVLLDVISEFPFINESDKSVALSYFLTVIQRRVLPTAPYHIVDAPMPGSGKGLLADIGAIIATGKPSTTVSLGTDEHETEKRVSASIMRGVAILNVDNIETALLGSFLCSFATQETLDIRILGTHKSVTIPTSSTTIVFTGNNVLVQGDLTRRVLLSRIDPEVERPDERTFKRKDLRRYTLNRRAKLLTAILTILKAHHHAGRPSHQKPVYGSFTDWDETIRSALIWLGCADPLETRENVDSADTSKDELFALLSQLSVMYGNQKFTTAMVGDAVKPKRVVNSNGGYTERPADENLLRALEPIAFARDRFNGHMFGKYLAANRGKVMGGLCLEKVGKRNGSYWRIKAWDRYENESLGV